MPYFGRQGQCLGMKSAYNLRKQVTFATGQEERSESPVGIQAKPYKPFNSTASRQWCNNKNMKNSKNRGGFTQVKAIFFSYKQTCTDIL